MSNGISLLVKHLIAGILLLAIGEAAIANCPNQNIVMLSVAEHRLNFNEVTPLCVREDETFRFKLIGHGGFTPDPSKLSVITKNEEDAIFSIDSIDTNMFIHVKVTDVSGNTAFPGYEIKYEDVGVLDPRVRIIDDVSVLGQQFVDLEDKIIDEFELSFGDLLEIENTISDFRDDDNLTLPELLRILKAESGYK